MSEQDSAIDIDSWRHSVPSRLEREDPFANDGFGERPATRLTFREQDPPEEAERPVSRFSLLRSKLFAPKRPRQSHVGYDSDDESTIYQRPATALSSYTKKGRKRGFLAGLFRRGKKRARDEYEDKYYQDEQKEETLASAERASTIVEPILSKPLHLNFLFVGCPSSGQTSLLYRIRYGYFPDTSVMPRTRDAATLQAIVAWWKFTAESLFSKFKAIPPTLRLLGTKKDLRHRSASSRRFSLGYYYHQLPLSASAQSVMASTCVSSAQATWQAKYLNAKYYECSALTGEGVDYIVEETAAEATRAIVEKEYDNSENTADRMALLLVGSLAVASAAIVVGLALSTFSWRIIILTAIALTAQVTIFITVRHIQLIFLKRRLKWSAAPRLTTSRAAPAARRDDDYHLFVLGSGGHTKEMLMMMDDGTCDFGRRFHRRYLVSSGDTMSAHALRDYEASLAALCAARGTDPGTHDAVRVARARRVHQSLLTTPLSALRSLFDIVPVLRRPGRRYPSLVFSNGPATGFFVALAIHVLKMLYVVPEGSMRFVYVESWARVSTLSVTGKLFHYTGLADFFAVQHAQVAARYGIRDVGQIVFNARRQDI
ncbi:hypothetical protein LMH87_003238 [Akanthomyces muscarius]|uniref:UDP-N-acetylglucosamine transferase subunit ALG14 n=1 Tax=Akanthomyces muscarius TaxID=2231603 RepID=A0A9W8Q409_AKAMU|nr:hypothetical protein LMH87_003238 [Akanthomyces muscarius]KAJ4144352.1 hypothetical protein LMH87_003238 [Akanthomyces muscarius]